VAYDEDLADRVREVLAGERFTEKRMFGGLAFLLGGHLSVAVSGAGGLMVRVAPEDTQALLSEAGTAVVDMGRGPVRGWLRVEPSVVDDDDALRGWVARGTACARALPEKG
jgi:hypothetical protein